MQSFLDTVLPVQGQRVAGVLAKKIFQNIFVPDNATLAATCQQIDGRSKDTYFALAGYGPDKKRTKDNVVALRSLWLDLDTREFNHTKATYADRKEAILAVNRFVNAVGLPKPWLVSSGWGIHVYFPLDCDVGRDAWEAMAYRLKHVAFKFGLDADPARTADCASVLRPVGAHNFKNPAKTRDVMLVQKGDITAPEDMLGLLDAHVDAGFTAAAQSTGDKHLHASGTLNDDLLLPPTEYAPTSVHRIAEHCGVMGLVRDTRGDVDQPTWYHALQLIGSCDEGNSVIHDFSDGHRAYSVRETEQTFARASGHGPTSCSKFAELQPAICNACPHLGKIKSPIRLGEEANEPQRLRVEEPVVGAAPANPATRFMHVDFPTGYGYGIGQGWAGSALWYTKYEEDDEGVKHAIRIPFSDVLLYPVARVVDVDGHHSMRMHMRTRRNETREFDLPLTIVSDRAKALFSVLGAHEIMTPRHAQNPMSDYLFDWATKLRDEYDRTPNVDQFGWYGDAAAAEPEGFVIGRRMITKAGVRRVVVGSDLSKIADDFTTEGTRDTWVETTDKLYNAPGMEGLQYLVMLSFGAALMRMVKDEVGVTVYAASGSGGYGKTTALFAGLTAWGRQTRRTVLQNDQYTSAALFQKAGVLHNLPLIVDEMTNIDPKFASSLIYGVSGGSDRSRLNQNGKMKDTKGFATLVGASGNVLLSEAAALRRANAQAELTRIFEFTLRERPTHITVMEANALMQNYQSNYGVVGEEYAQYLVNNYSAVKTELMDVRDSLNRAMGLTTAERFWAMSHSTVLLSLKICRRLGLIKFPLKPMIDFIETETENMRRMINGSISTPLDLFGEMLADIALQIIVTEGPGDVAAQRPATVRQEPKRTPIVGRIILNTPGIYAKVNVSETMYISRAAAQEWATKRGASLRMIEAELTTLGALVTTNARVSLGKGTINYQGVTSVQRCLEVRLPRLLGLSATMGQTITGVVQGPGAAVGGP